MRKILGNPYPIIVTASLGVCVGLLLGAIFLLIRVWCRLRAARSHAPRRSVALQCEMFAGKPAILVRSTATQTQANANRPNSGFQHEPQSIQVQQQQQQRMVSYGASTTMPNHQQGNQQGMQAMAAMCAQTTTLQGSVGEHNPSIYAGPSAGSHAGKPLLVPQHHQMPPPTMSTSLGSSSFGSQQGQPFPNAPSRSYTYTPRLSVRWFQ